MNRSNSVPAKTRQEVQVFTYPFRHVVIDNFLNFDLANQVEQEFPEPEEISFYQNTPGRFLSWHMNFLDPAMNSLPAINTVLKYLESQPVREQLAEIFQIKTKLLCNPYYAGSGLLVSNNECIHKIHRDRNYDPDSHYYRRLVLLVYFNKNWQPEHGGTLSLWNKDLRRHTAVEPLLNRCVVFENTKHAYHDVSDLHLPKGTTRKAINFYYYTETPPESEQDMYIHNTEFFPRPDERFQYWKDVIFKGFPLYLLRALAPKCVPLTRALHQSGFVHLWLLGKAALARLISYEKYQQVINSREWKFFRKPTREVRELWQKHNAWVFTQHSIR